MFKVGDRVWVISEKRYGIVSDIEDTPQGLFIHIDNRHSYVPHLIHQTAQTMFEALGYDECEKTLNTLVYISNRFTITFDLKNKEYWHDNDSSITVEEHLAIHQQLIELAWL